MPEEEEVELLGAEGAVGDTMEELRTGRSSGRAELRDSNARPAF